MEKDITFAQVSVMKQELDKEIARLIRVFQNETGANVRDIIFRLYSHRDLDKVKYARICKDAPKEFKLAVPEIVWDCLFVVSAIIAVVVLAYLAHGLLFLFSI